MTAAIRKLWRRPPSERRLLAHAVLLHSVVAVLIRITRFGALSRWGAAVYPQRVASSGDRALDDRVGWAVTTATAFLPIGRTCLTEALTAHCLLRAAGRPSALRFGVAAGHASRLVAHAWVETNGRPIRGFTQPASYQPLE